ncbi:MAG: hypothetical protein MI919_34130 [Holophagales bacterium]|nr:hypothetical protein [Holophagales bacterium]
MLDGSCMRRTRSLTGATPKEGRRIEHTAERNAGGRKGRDPLPEPSFASNGAATEIQPILLEE